jgi:limonene-1,2-epoxide hydrolase
MDADEFAQFITEDGTFVFGNAEPVSGRTAVRDAVDGFYRSIRGLHHQVAQTWEGDGTVVAEGRVTYTRHDAGTVTLPFVNVFRLDGELVRDYRIYIDITPLYAP